MGLARFGITYNDGVLLMSLIYSGVDVSFEWDRFNECAHPVHKWLLTSYLAIVAFRMAHIAGSLHVPAGGGNFLLDLRTKAMVPRVLMMLTWFVVMPFFTLWTFVGTWWLTNVLLHSPGCIPTETHKWFLILWQLLSYVWIGIHGMLGSTAWVLERRLCQAERDLRQLADPDTIARWGENFSELPGYSSLPAEGSTSSSLTAVRRAQALTPSEILALPGPDEFKCRSGGKQEDTECAICLADINEGDSVRTLVGCSHTFHRACVDLWLLRRADCPLCKRDVRSGALQA